MKAANQVAEDLAQHGYTEIRRMVSPEEAAAIATLATGGGSLSRGTRNLLDAAWCRNLAAWIRSLPALSEVLRDNSVAVQCTWFEKSKEANWLVPPHQDRNVPVRERVEHPALGAWSIKEGQPFVVAPAPLLEQMLAVRIHLDPCGPEDGPLRIGERMCLAEPGDALLMRPLTVHSSSKATGDGRRRVLHYLFGPADPGYGLQWR